MGNTNSFKIGIDYKYFQTLHNEEFWPEHVICRRFFLKKSYSQANQHQHNNRSDGHHGQRFMRNHNGRSYSGRYDNRGANNNGNRNYQRNQHLEIFKEVIIPTILTI